MRFLQKYVSPFIDDAQFSHTWCLFRSTQGDIGSWLDLLDRTLNTVIKVSHRNILPKITVMRRLKTRLRFVRALLMRKEGKPHFCTPLMKANWNLLPMIQKRLLWSEEPLTLEMYLRLYFSSTSLATQSNQFRVPIQYRPPMGPCCKPKLCSI